MAREQARNIKVQYAAGMKILLFAHLKDVLGCSQIECPLQGPVTLDAFWDRLLEDYPALQAHRHTLRVSRNLEFVTSDTLLCEGDEIALIPPVSGG
jgi:molybdopterin converting factor small subunit